LRNRSWVSRTPSIKIGRMGNNGRRRMTLTSSWARAHSVRRFRLRNHGSAGNNEELRRHLLRPGRADRQRFLALLVVNVTELALDAGNPKNPKLPNGALQTRTDFGAPGYGGPCPPQGDHPHRYLFTVFAVGVDSLPVNADTSAAVIGFQLNFNTLAKSAIMGLYKR